MSSQHPSAAVNGRGAPAGNVRAATPTYHLDTVRLALVDLRGHRDQLLRRAERRATRLRAEVADHREARAQAAEIDAMIEEVAQALHRIDGRAAHGHTAAVA